MSISFNGQTIQTVDHTNTLIKLNITHSNLKLFVPEHRFDLFDTIGHIKVIFPEIVIRE
jgi:hypothetical protein